MPQKTARLRVTVVGKNVYGPALGPRQYGVLYKFGEGSFGTLEVAGQEEMDEYHVGEEIEVDHPLVQPVRRYADAHLGAVCE